MDLEKRLEELRGEALRDLAGFVRRQESVSPLDEVERDRVEEHVLLLDPDGERSRARAEAMVDDARLGARGRPSGHVGAGAARPGGRRVYTVPVTPSASISTSQRGSTSSLMTTVVLAGRISENASPWARPTPSKSSASDEVDTRAHHVGELGAGLAQGHFDDLEAALGLAVGVRRGLDALRHDRSGSRDEDPVTDRDGARVPDVRSYGEPDEMRRRDISA